MRFTFECLKNASCEFFTDERNWEEGEEWMRF